MNFTGLALDGVLRVELEPLEDERGFFARSFCKSEFAAQGLFADVAQINSSYTARKGSIRGLHFQRAPAAEAKLVRVVRGAICDVAVDLRSGSRTFGQWVSERLSADNRRALYIPEGFAHGFQTLSDNVEIIYLHSVPFAPGLGGGVRFDDREIGVDWPLPVSVISLKDQELPSLNSTEPLEP